MRHQLFYAAAFILLIQGCATASYRFVHADKPPSEYERDKYECGLVAREATDDIEFADNPLVRGPAVAQEFADCMQHRYGWQRVICSSNEPGCNLYFAN